MRKYLLLLVVFSIIEISLSLYLTEWRQVFWDSMVAKNSEIFMSQIGIFTIIALILCFVVGYSGYIVNLATIKWRTILNSRITNTNYRVNSKIENIEQRIQEDCSTYPELFLSLGFGTIKAIGYIFVFSVSIINNFAYYYLLILVVYGIIGTYLAKKVAYPLIRLNYKTQQAEASYRKKLTKENFLICTSLMGLIALRRKYLSYFQSFYSQLGIIVPLLLIAPEYFTSAITVGLLMRFNSLSGTLLDNLSYGITSFGDINRLLSCRTRLKEARIL